MAAQQQSQAAGCESHGKERILQKRRPISELQKEQIVSHSIEQHNGPDDGQNTADGTQYFDAAVGKLRGTGDAAAGSPAGPGLGGGSLRRGLGRRDGLLSAAAALFALAAVRELGDEHNETHGPGKGEQDGNNDPRPHLVFIRFVRLHGVSALIHGSYPPAQRGS